MQQVYLRKAFQLVQEEAEIPAPGSGQVLVKVEICGICATDVHSYEGETVQGNHYPFHPGHEIAGVVAKIGPGVTGLAAGDKVVIDPLYPCEACDFCRENQQNHCTHLKTLGMIGPGGFSDFTVVPAKNVYRFEAIDFKEAAFAEPLSSVVYASNRAEIGKGDRVLIYGAGPIGLLHLQMALHSGSAMVVMNDLNPQKLALAEKLGASATVSAAAPDADLQLKKLAPSGFDVVIDCTGVAKVVERSLSFLKNSGRLVIFGVCPQNSEIRLNPFQIYRRDLKIIGVFAANRTMKATVALLENRIIRTEELVAEIIPRARLEEAFKLLKQGKVNGKILVVPQ
ncbi:2-desacetyl-2-hydroxyethyl bacteriochlorophyllide A dehydrogenase [Hydrogenispora ethanolica]|uniref:2-desacetyl-2-hydroxyethyl bacteriochlorophyllide A dehydrogenase n=1 Tax=Hydrogenispora ethanolica TaxID=1082276 RepID=A0A4R1SAZ6_HYDET|nr:alcohol dehydrogenase catalytic domain-containing protein [Hydrogenispora ethanolica]TCL76549.1 2-desacetyl-2-hydroxyethyl bacteriochlorophyllide A dehydrogenase [Hydrogenispora ethanolica]